MALPKRPQREGFDVQRHEIQDTPVVKLSSEEFFVQKDDSLDFTISEPVIEVENDVTSTLADGFELLNELYTDEHPDDMEEVEENSYPTNENVVVVDNEALNDSPKYSLDEENLLASLNNPYIEEKETSEVIPLEGQKDLFAPSSDLDSDFTELENAVSNLNNSSAEDFLASYEENRDQENTYEEVEEAETVVEPEFIAEPIRNSTPARIPTRPGASVYDEKPAVETPSLNVKKRLEEFSRQVDEQANDDISELKRRGFDLTSEKSARSYRRTAPKAMEKKEEHHITSVTFGGITPKEAIDGDYRIYAHLDQPIQEMVNYIQTALSEQGKSEAVGKARKARGTDIYNQMYQDIDRMITRALTTNETMGIEMEDTAYFTARVSNEILGFGPLEPLWADNSVSEVMVNGPYDIRVERFGIKKRATGIRFFSQEHAMKVANSFLALSGRTFSTKSPNADAALPDGSRLNAIHPEIAPGGPYLTIRRFPDTAFSLERLVEKDSMTEDMAHFMGNIVRLGASIVIAGATGTGKALDVNTLIPTPAGMIRLGDLKVGDLVYDENGKPTAILAVYPQPLGRECFEVTFSDNSTVIADSEHNWFVNGVIKTTQELVDTFDDNVFILPIAKPLQLPEQNLPLDPYLLGFWLACGNSNGKISAENRHAESILMERGHKISRQFGMGGNLNSVFLTIEGFTDKLDAIGLLGNENDNDALVLPEAYLLASEEQRRDLLAGLMDNGGILHRRKGYIEFIVSNNEKLADQIVRLISSLGMVANRKSIDYDGSVTTIVLETRERVFKCEDLAQLHESLDFIIPSEKRIIGIKSVDSVDVTCITVDSPNSLYLFGNEHTVTHNTSMLNALSGCIPDEERIITIEDTLELKLNERKHVLSMQSRPANPSGEDAITIRDIVKYTLRMAPDRIVVGEVRDQSAFDMMQALNTGHDGSLTTTHASNAGATVERLSLLISQAGEVGPDQAIALIAGGIDIFVNIVKFEDGSRRVSTISEVPSSLELIDGRTVLNPITLFEFVRDGMDENNKVIGHYEKINDMSESLIRKHSLDKRPWMSLEDLYENSSIPEPEAD